MEDNLYNLTTFGHNYTLANVFIILNIYTFKHETSFVKSIYCEILL